MSSIDTSVQSKDGVGGGRKGTPSASTRRKSEVRSRIFRELIHIAAEQGASISMGISTGDALQECLDRAVAIWRFAADQVDSIVPPDTETSLANLPPTEDPLFFVQENPQGPDIITTHRYFQMEREARLEIEKLAAMMTQLGIAERVVRVEEAKAALLIAAIHDVAPAVGITQDQVRQLGSALRERFTTPSNQEQHPERQARANKIGTVGPTRHLVAESKQIEKAVENAEPS